MILNDSMAYRGMALGAARPHHQPLRLGGAAEERVRVHEPRLVGLGAGAVRRGAPRVADGLHGRPD